MFIGFDYLGLSQEDSEENVRTGMEAKGYQVSEEEKKIGLHEHPRSSR